MIEQVKLKLQLQRYSDSTIHTYLSCLEKYISELGIDKVNIYNKEDIRTYIHQLVNKGLSKSYQNQMINAIKFYYEKVLGKQREVYYIERPIKDKKLPSVLSSNEVERILQQINNRKHKCMIVLLYSSGLRIGELINLKIKNIDSSRMVIHIEDAKGNKDRIVPLPQKLLDLLREYYKIYKPKDYLFNGQFEPRYTSESVRKIISNACKKAKINKRVSPHTFRHSYATHLLEKGIDIRYIQSLLGHNSIKTTEIYTHVSKSWMEKMHNPVDDLNF